MTAEKKAIIGMEVHVQLNTESKLFCGCPALPQKGAWVKDYLEQEHAVFEFVEHEAVTRPINSAKARGVQVKQIAKALVYVCDNEPVLFILSGDRKLDDAKAMRALNCSVLRMAKPEEVKEFTGCIAGLVPPVIEGVRKVIDKRLLENELLSFNAGIATAGIKISKGELLKVLGKYEKAEISDDVPIVEKPGGEKLRPETVSAEKDAPNSRTCEICLGMPGSKPVLNRKALDFSITAALALNCSINEEFFFSRKTYFYPDMAKNFQISQYELPVGTNGFLQLQGGKKIRIRRVHLEEDPAALVHENGMAGSNYCLVDYNRSGIPLIEVVTEPDIDSPKEAREFMDALLNILNYLGIFVQGIGVMKADANISIEGNERAEVKNISSFRGIEKALGFEAARQRSLIARGERMKRETRAYVAENDTTVPLRSKESEEDYGYIFDADLPSFSVSEKSLSESRQRLPELPEQKAKRFVKEFKVAESDARILCGNFALAKLFEEVAAKAKPELAARFLSRELLAIMNYSGHDLSELKLDSSAIAELLQLVSAGKVSEKNAKEAMIKYANEKILPIDFLKRNNLLIDLKEGDLESAVEKVIQENKKAFEELKAGNAKSLNFLVGLIMRQTKGKADPRSVQKIIEEKAKEK